MSVRHHPEVKSSLTPFVNEPFLDLTDRIVVARMTKAFAEARDGAPRHYPVIIDGRHLETGPALESVNPANPAEVLATVRSATIEDIDAAIAASRRHADHWRDRPASERAAILIEAARLMRERRVDLAAWMTLEVGKSWFEADADVCEAIDFLEYYAREAVRLGDPILLPGVPGELNHLYYQGRGVAAIIAPWNFPLAILTGMAAAALAAGNAAVVKPARQSPGIAAQLCGILLGAGVPAGVLHFVPGPGSLIGNHLVAHPGVDLIAFTGSVEVGLGILELAGKVVPGQLKVKHVISEMGGKNAIIVDTDADLDLVVPGVVRSAFGYQGQKCSACSRLIVVGNLYDEVTKRVVQATRNLKIGPPEDPVVNLGPVIDGGAQKSMRSYIEVAKRDCTLLYEGPVPVNGYYVSPTIFGDVPPDHRIAQEEIFGPVLAVLRAADFDQALQIANGTQFALTGGVYSSNPEHLRKARRAFQVGNLYLNRHITGAMVARQPFGGFRMSGVGSKAGGPDYLLQFMEPRTVTENTGRKGYHPLH